MRQEDGLRAVAFIIRMMRLNQCRSQHQGHSLHNRQGASAACSDQPRSDVPQATKNRSITARTRLSHLEVWERNNSSEIDCGGPRGSNRRRLSCATSRSFNAKIGCEGCKTPAELLRRLLHSGTFVTPLLLFLRNVVKSFAEQT